MRQPIKVFRQGCVIVSQYNNGFECDQVAYDNHYISSSGIVIGCLKHRSRVIIPVVEVGFVNILCVDRTFTSHIVPVSLEKMVPVRALVKDDKLVLTFIQTVNGKSELFKFRYNLS